MQQIIFNGATADATVEQIKREGPCAMVKHHLHGAYEIYYLLSGDLSYFIEKETYHLEKGGLVFINEGRIHRTTYNPAIRHERILIELDTHFMEKMEQLFPSLSFTSLLSGHGFVFQLPAEEQERVEGLLFGIIRELRDKKTGFAESAQVSLMELTLFMLRKSAENEPSAPPIRNAQYQKVYEITNYIMENYQTLNSLQNLCDHFYLNKYYLCHIFKQVTGLTVKEYINAIRIKNAKELLASREDTITTISQAVGYDSVTHFDRVFKEYTGISPLQYRKLHIQ